MKKETIELTGEEVKLIAHALRSLSWAPPSGTSEERLKITLLSQKIAEYVPDQSENIWKIAPWAPSDR